MDEAAVEGAKDDGASCSGLSTTVRPHLSYADHGKMLRASVRSGQLHRSTNLPFRPRAQSAPPPLRLLAFGRRLHGHSPARLFSRDLRVLLRRHLPRTCLARVGGQLGQRRDDPGMGILGFLGRAGGGPQSFS